MNYILVGCPLICTMIILQIKIHAFLGFWLALIIPQLIFSFITQRRQELIIKGTHHAWKQQKQQHQGIFKPEIGDRIMDHISFIWPNFFFICNILFYKNCFNFNYWFNLKYTYTLFISCTIKPCMWWGSNLFLAKFSKLHCWLVLNFLCCQGLGDQGNWESTCKVTGKSKVSWNQIWPAVITYCTGVHCIQLQISPSFYQS